MGSARGNTVAGSSQKSGSGMVEGSSTAYLAIAGGLALPAFMGSLSTYTRAGIGGILGRAAPAAALNQAAQQSDTILNVPGAAGGG